MDTPSSSSRDGDELPGDINVSNSASLPPVTPSVPNGPTSVRPPSTRPRQVIALVAFWEELPKSDMTGIRTFLDCSFGPSFAFNSTLVQERLHIEDEDPTETLMTAIRRATLRLQKEDIFCLLYSGLKTDKIATSNSSLIAPNPTLENWIERMVQTGTWPEDSRRLLSDRQDQDTTQQAGNSKTPRSQQVGQEGHILLYGTNTLGEDSAQVHYNTIHQTCFAHADFEVLSSIES